MPASHQNESEPLVPVASDLNPEQQAGEVVPAQNVRGDDEPDDVTPVPVSHSVASSEDKDKEETEDAIEAVNQILESPGAHCIHRAP